MWTLHEGDCLEIMPQLPVPDKSIDMILCDLPYGTTACKWDVIIPFEPLWREYERLIKDNGAIVLTGIEPFSSLLRMSNFKIYRYDWVWDKVKTGNPLNAKKCPLPKTENISVFYKKPPAYNPIMTKRDKVKKSGNVKTNNIKCFNGLDGKNRNYTHKYPTNLITLSNANQHGKLHPTQKPVALFEYLIKTYTNPGETVLDNCAGSGTTGIAAENCGRNSIMIEKEQKYCEIIRQRMTALEGGLFNEGV